MSEQAVGSAGTCLLPLGHQFRVFGRMWNVRERVERQYVESRTITLWCGLIEAGTPACQAAWADDARFPALRVGMVVESASEADLTRLVLTGITQTTREPRGDAPPGDELKLEWFDVLTVARQKDEEQQRRDYTELGLRYMRRELEMDE